MGNKPDGVPQGVYVGIAHVYTVELHAATGDIKQAGQQRDEGGFPGPRGPHNGQGLALVHVDVNVRHDRVVGTGVSELDVCEGDGTAVRELGDALVRPGDGA